MPAHAIQGRKGGKGGGGGTVRVAQEAPNTLRSRATARIVDVISEGEIVGLVNGLQSVFFDDTPLQNTDGSFNFGGVTLEARTGTPDQDHVPGFSAAENEVPVGAQLTQATPLVRTVTNDDVDAVRIKVRLPALTFQDTSNGDLKGYQVEFAIDVRASGGAWVEQTLGYEWKEFTSTTGATSTGLRVTAETNLTGPVGSRQSGTVTVEYRKVGDPSWTQLGSRLLTQTITRSNNVNNGFGGWQGGYTSTASVQASATFEITGLPSGQYEVRATAGTITARQSLDPAPIRIAGKTTSPYERSYRIPLPAGGSPWDIRLRRISPDSQQANIQDKLFWSSYTELIESRLIYPDSALVALTVDAQQFGNRIPQRGYEVQGLIIQVPSNYDPQTRAYTGLWDGTFKRAWSDNPAWVLYDLLTNPRYGLGRDIDAAQIDKWSLYSIAQYCDELVDDGFGGQEPRFRFNGVISGQAEAYDVINSIASAFRGMLYWATGAVVATQDSPADPVKLVTPANVIDGQFNYEGAALKARHSVALVSWNDPADGYRPAIVVVEDPEMIERFGWRQTNIVAYGCTSKGQAVRFGRWILDSERNETETVSYRAALDHADVRPGDIIAVADPAWAGVRFGGRVAGASTTQVTVDAAVTLDANETYTLSVVLPDGSVEDRGVTTAPGTVTVLDLDSALSAVPQTGAMWVLTATNVAPRRFRVVAVTEEEKNIFQITALFHDPTKYARVEQGLFLEEPAYTLLPTGALSPPSAISGSEYLYQAGAAIRSAVTLSWSASPDPRTVAYEVQILPPGAADWHAAGRTEDLSLDILDTADGYHQFRVRSVDAIGRPSAWATWSTTLLALAAPPADVTGFRISVIGDQAHLSWDPVADLDLSHYVIRYADSQTADWLSAAILLPHVDATSVTVPALSGRYLIKAVDTSGMESAAAAVIDSTIAGLLGFNAVATITEDPGWSGVHNQTVYDSGLGGLRLDSDQSVLDWPDFLAVANVFGGLASSGTYDFAGSLDLGAVYTSRVTASLTAQGIDLDNDVLSIPDMLAWPDVLGGIDATEYDIFLEVRTTGDDPAGAPVWSPWTEFQIGDYTARAFEFRVRLYSFRQGATPIITALSVQIDMPDRVEAAEDLVCPAAGLNVTFTPAFKARPAIAVSGQNMATGDYYSITNQTAAGFDIRFFDSTGTGVSRTFDYVAKGYGVNNT